jgi:Lrp/AsnC family transcriptional regulator, leucine-responsive regulatory protein
MPSYPESLISQLADYTRGMQDLDADILRLLQKNAKLTYEQIGRALDRPPSTIRDRIKRMEDDRTILGYSVIIDPQKVGVGIVAFISADISPERSSEAMTRLSSLENVHEIMHLTGERKILIMAHASDNHELMEFVDREIRPLGFEDLEVTVVLESIVRFPGI